MKNEGATQLAKVLWYYNLIPDVHQLSQKIICPFHDDVNPSLRVNLEDGTWYCFGCSLSGGAVQFVMNMEANYNGLNDLQAQMKYHNILRSDKCSHIHIDPKLSQKSKMSSKEAYNEAYDYYHGLRNVNWNEDDEQEIDHVRTYMESRGFTADTLNKCKAKVTYSLPYSMIFPMLDNGKFKGWVSRTMIKKIAKKRKYLYNEGFARRNTLVGNYGQHNWVIAVEGYMDALKFIQYGVTNVVALLGWKITKQQEAKLRNAGVVHIISALDNDVHGKKGTMYLKSLFGPNNVYPWWYLKGIKDPGDMTQVTFERMYSKTMTELKYNLAKNKKRRHVHGNH